MYHTAAACVCRYQLFACFLQAHAPRTPDGFSAVFCASYCTQKRENLLDLSVRSSLSDRGALAIQPSYGWRAPFTLDVCCLLFSKLPVRCYAVGTVNTLKVAACVTAAGRAPSVTFPPTSALTSHAAAMGPALWGRVSATRATKARTAKKVMALISHAPVAP